MNLNATVLVQILFFITFVFITVKYIWPSMKNVLEKRRKEIANGLAASEQGRKSLEEAEIHVRILMKQASMDSEELLRQTQKRCDLLLHTTKEEAQKRADQMIAQCHLEIDQQYIVLQEQLKAQTADWIQKSLEQIIPHMVHTETQKQLIEEVLKGIVSQSPVDALHAPVHTE